MGSAHYLTLKGCRSFDGEIGKTVESGYQDERDCNDCDYRYGFTNEKGEKISCKSQYTLFMEHEDPEKEFVLTISYGAQKNLDAYAEKLAAQGIDVDQVITGITRVENTKTAGTTYIFEKLGDLQLVVTKEEGAALENLKSKAISGGPIPVRFAVTILQNLVSLEGISENRAIQLAESIAVDGMITGKI